MEQHEHDGPIEIAIVGDLTDNETELTDKLLGVAPGGSARCTSTRPAAARTAPCR